MATDEVMRIAERDQYLRRMKRHYQQADRKTRSALLDQMVTYTGLHRKSVIRRLMSRLQSQPRNRERGPEYGSEVDAALRLIWEALDYVCPERLQPNLVSTGQLLAQHAELSLPPALAAQLAQISVSTVRRHLPPTPHVHRRRPPQPPQNRYQTQIPAYRIPRDIAEPGHLEVDLVHHCGPVTAGDYVYTVQMVDVATGWCGCRAILGRSYLVMADALAYLLAQLPFPVRELHPDNGSELLNAHLLTFLQATCPGVTLSRSRPGTPNDNRLVEEKNGSRVRHYLGDRRFDTVIQTRFLNTLYARLDRYHNLIQPVMRQIDKVWIPATTDHPGYLQRRHDTAQPPLARLCAILGQEHPQCLALHSQRAQINPLQFRRTLYRDLDHLFAYPNASPDQVEDVFQTLADPERFTEDPQCRQVVDTVDLPHHYAYLPSQKGERPA